MKKTVAMIVLVCILFMGVMPFMNGTVYANDNDAASPPVTAQPFCDQPEVRVTKK